MIDHLIRLRIHTLMGAWYLWMYTVLPNVIYVCVFVVVIFYNVYTLYIHILFYKSSNIMRLSTIMSYKNIPEYKKIHVYNIFCRLFPCIHFIHVNCFTSDILSDLPCTRI